ncbi:MAG: NAD(P)/FAD-dependent oxidoreductase [Candidatus Saccharimonadales bacterium]
MVETKPQAEHEVRDVIMIGAGPSALAAAVYTTREDIDTVIYEKGVIGGLAAITDWVDNYPGFAKGISGLNLAGELQAQAERFGAMIRFGEVTNVVDEGHLKRVETTDGPVWAKAVLIATGSSYRKLNVPGEDEYYGRGVHYCATCDGAFYRDKKLVVVGGGNSAVQEALFLTKFATHIDMLVRSTVKASEILQHELDKAVKAGKITLHLGVETKEIADGKDGKVSKVIATQKDKTIEFKTDGVFIFIGLLPNTDFLKKSEVMLDEMGFVLTDANLQTNLHGVFCAGDVRSGATMQIASAVGEGATAALKMREYLELQERAHATPVAETV